MTSKACPRVWSLGMFWKGYQNGRGKGIDGLCIGNSDQHGDLVPLVMNSMSQMPFRNCKCWVYLLAPISFHHALPS